MKNFGTNLPQLDLTWANLFGGPSCEYINLWQHQHQQQQWERRASFPTLKSVQVVCHNLIQFGADNMQHASNNNNNKNKSNKKSYRAHNLLMTYKSRAVHWLARPLTPSLSLPLSLSVSSLAQMLSNRIRNTRRAFAAYMTNLPSCTQYVSVYVCVWVWVWLRARLHAAAHLSRDSCREKLNELRVSNWKKVLKNRKSFISRLINRKEAKA